MTTLMKFGTSIYSFPLLCILYHHTYCTDVAPRLDTSGVAAYINQEPFFIVDAGPTSSVNMLSPQFNVVFISLLPLRKARPLGQADAKVT